MNGSLGLGGNFYLNNTISTVVNPATFGTTTATLSNTMAVSSGQTFAVSYSGQYVLTGFPQSSSGRIALSTNYGYYITPIVGQPFSSNGGTAVTMSSDGSKMACTDTTAVCYVSTNYGVNWSSGVGTGLYFIAATNDFTKLFALGNSGVYLSTNTGSSFTLISTKTPNSGTIKGSYYDANSKSLLVFG
jgi:hypothetical protein